MTGTFDSNAYQRNRRKKRELVGAGTAHGTIAMCGDEPVAWCQFGPREELPRIDTRRGYAPTARGAWRVTCFYVDRRHRRQGFGRYSLLESMEEMKRLGVRAVEAYPVEGRRSATLLWSGTPELFEGAGFSRVGHLGKNSWVYSIELPKRARRQR